MSSVNMNAWSVFVKEAERLRAQIKELQYKVDYVDTEHTETRLTQDKIWDLSQALHYIEGRISELS